MMTFENYLNGLNIKYDVKHLGLINRKNKEWPNECDHYLVNISRNGNEIETDFYCGLGNRKPYAGTKLQANGQYYNRILAKWAPNMVNAAEQGFFLPVKPKLADVMYCLVLDASMAEETHADWCANLGYDVDSIKARDIYMKCQEHRSKMLRMFDRETFGQLVELSGEY